MRASLARPQGAGPFPAVVVIHENRGLNPHIEDVTRRAAAAGFWALAPDALSPSGGTPADPDAAREAIQKLDMRLTTRDFVAAVAFAGAHAETTGQVGCVGFCWGGAMANQLAVEVPGLSAAVAFYGRQPDKADVPRIKAAVQLHYAGLDERINAGIADYEAALKEAGVRYELHMYDGVDHAFHNDTSVQRYNETAAKLAWKRTIEFLDRYVRSDAASPGSKQEG
jgi:carboxymethylenebutenolidase